MQGLNLLTTLEDVNSSCIEYTSCALTFSRNTQDLDYWLLIEVDVNGRARNETTASGAAPQGERALWGSELNCGTGALVLSLLEGSV